MGAKQKPSKWDTVIPETLDHYICLCRCNVRRKLPPRVKEAVDAQMKDDLDQEIYCLALEAFNKRLSVPEASRLFKNGIYKLVRGVGGWKLGYIKKEKRQYWARVEISNLLSTEWNEEDENFKAQVYRRLGIPKSWILS